MIKLSRGFTLIELMIALSIFGLLIFLALPLYSDFMGNTQIRNAAENSLTGVRLAQTTAIKGNHLAKFVIDATGWAVYDWNDEASPADFFIAPLQSYKFADGAPRITPTFTPGGAVMVTFDGLGRVAPNADASASLTRVDITNPSVGNPRPLRLIITGVGGNSGIKLCDPAADVVATDPRVCPA